MAIGEICNREVIIARGNETVAAVAELMRRHHVGSVVVVEGLEGQWVPLGIVTDRDIVVGVVAKGLDPQTIEAAEVMGTSLVKVKESAGVSETIELMRAHGVRRLPVTGENGALAGIVAVDDLVDLLAEEMGALARLVSRERQGEESARAV
ncbi:MAG: CBS domain-containing protein [Betaproteobacteria bacterium]|nr:CBS domain-containing protein [Betaproteobacteria bacterium]